VCQFDYAFYYDYNMKLKFSAASDITTQAASEAMKAAVGGSKGTFTVCGPCLLPRFLPSPSILHVLSIDYKMVIIMALLALSSSLMS
jgi:hypothetical protein